MSLLEKLSESVNKYVNTEKALICSYIYLIVPWGQIWTFCHNYQPLIPMRKALFRISIRHTRHSRPNPTPVL